MSEGDLIEHLDPETRRILTETEALRTGHFILTSGKRSPIYFQAMKLLQHPEHAIRAADAVAAQFSDQSPTCTLAPAVGGITWGFAVARSIPGCRALFAERVEGKLTLRRSFKIQATDRVILTEDVITTGGTVDELRSLIESSGATILGIAALLDRSGGAYQPGIPVRAWATISAPTYDVDQVPGSLRSIPPEKPGSRGLA